jgi:hypothetical protein
LPPCSRAIRCTVSTCSRTPASVPWNSKKSVGASTSVVRLYALTAAIVRSHRYSLRAIGTPSWIAAITVSTADARSGKLATAAEIASGTGYRRTVTSVITPSVPSEPTKRRVRS